MSIYSKLETPDLMRIAETQENPLVRELCTRLGDALFTIAYLHQISAPRPDGHAEALQAVHDLTA